MKRKDFVQLKELNLSQLEDMLKKANLESAKIRLEVKKGKIKNNHAWLNKRKEIAQILTLISEKSFIEKGE